MLFRRFRRHFTLALKQPNGKIKNLKVEAENTIDAIAKAKKKYPQTIYVDVTFRIQAKR